jgi:hypothetical protein
MPTRRFCEAPFVLLQRLPLQRAPTEFLSILCGAPRRLGWFIHCPAGAVIETAAGIFACFDCPPLVGTGRL